MQALKRFAVVTIIAAACAFGCRTAGLGPQPMAPTQPAAARVPVPAGTIWLILVDDLHVDFRNTGRLRDFLKRIDGELIQDGDSFAVRSTGPSELAIDVTSDRTLLAGAIRKTSGAGLSPVDILEIGAAGTIPNEVLYRTDVALSAAQEFVKAAQKSDGRRMAFVYISTGYSIDPSADVSVPSTAAKGIGGRAISVVRLREHMLALTRQAKEARIRIFTIDPRGLAPASSPDPRMDAAAWTDYLATTRKSLRFIAEQTGGFSEFEDLFGVLKRISRAMRHR